MTNKLILLGLFVTAMLIMSFRTEKKKKVIFFGDSITAAGVNPGGYIRLIDTIIQKAGLSNQYDLVGAGVSGNKVYDLYLRMEEDVLQKNPDIVLIYIGVNDVWHKAGSGTGTDYDKFGKFYEAFVDQDRIQKDFDNYISRLATVGITAEDSPTEFAEEIAKWEKQNFRTAYTQEYYAAQNRAKEQIKIILNKINTMY